MAKTDTEFRVGDIINRTEPQYTTITKTTFIDQLQDIPLEEQE